MDAAKTRLKKAKAAETRASVSSVFFFIEKHLRLINLKFVKYFTPMPCKLQSITKTTIWFQGIVFVFKQTYQNLMHPNQYKVVILTSSIISVITPVAKK